MNQYLILTHAQSTNLTGDGAVTINSQNDENPNVTLNHFGTNVDPNNNVYIDDIYNAYIKNHEIMSDLGYTLLSPNETTIDKNYIYGAADSIYHYHGSCAIGDVVDENQKVYNLSLIHI